MPDQPVRHVEREVKLGAPPGFELPPVGELIDEQHLDATYFDTADLRLVRAGVSCRHRAGDVPPWTVKLRDAGEGDAVERLEVQLEGDVTVVPQEVAALVRAYRRTAPLEPVARLRTTRRRIVVVDDGGRRVAEVDDDEVTVVDLGEPDKVLARFREIEVELAGDADAEVLDGIVARLSAAGAGAPDKTSKVVRALGPRALAAPDITPHELGDDPRAGEVLRAAIAAAAARIVDHDPVFRLDAGPEGVHQMRVGARRLRSDLRTFGPLLAGDWADPLREELGWLAGSLGDVRDADVMAMRLAADGASLAEEDRAAVEALEATLAKERQRALGAALGALDDDRYGRLLDVLVEVSKAPALTDEAAEPATDVVAPLAAKAWRKLAKAVKRLDDEPAPDALHRVRILAKRARYAADVVVPVVGKPAKELSKRLGNLQDALGAHQDAAVAQAWLRRAAAGLPSEQAVVAGQLIGMRLAAADVTTGEWKSAWKAAKKVHKQGRKAGAWPR